MSELPATYGDVTAEYLALRNEAALVAGRHELVWARGPDTVTFLDSLLTQDLTGREPGEVVRSLLLEPRGKLRAVLWVAVGDAACGLIADRGYGEVVVEDLNRFRIRVKVDIDAEPTPLLEVIGPESARALAGAGLPTPDGWAQDGGAFVARADMNGLPRYFVAGVGDVAGIRRAGGLAVDAARIEAGEPRMGVDVDEKTIPQESGLVAASVSFTKGCYLGQELVARIDSRGHVNRHLRGVVLGTNVLPPPGAALAAGGKEVGRITSLAESLELRAPVGLALVRREVAPGEPVEVRWEGGQAPATVAGLPLDDFTAG